MSLPGVCVVCRQPVVWRGKSWKNPGQWGQRHVCPDDRDICGMWMRNARAHCALRPGHAMHHLSRYAIENKELARTGVA